MFTRYIDKRNTLTDLEELNELNDDYSELKKDLDVIIGRAEYLLDCFNFTQYHLDNIKKDNHANCNCKRSYEDLILHLKNDHYNIESQFDTYLSKSNEMIENRKNYVLSLKNKYKI